MEKNDLKEAKVKEKKKEEKEEDVVLIKNIKR